MNRRDMITSTAAVVAASALGAPARPKTGVGVATYCFGIRQGADRARGEQAGINDPLNFLEYCRGLGAGGIQFPIGTRDKEYTGALRRKAEESGMYVEGIVGLPRDKSDVEGFEAQLVSAKQAGTRVIRVVIIPGRRYERFDSAEEFRKFAARGVRSLELAEPIAARHRVRLAVENHKDQRIPERLEVLKRLSSEYVGACVDLGNSFSLLEDSTDVVEAFAPYAFSVHLKDQGVAEYEDGFLFADVVLGEGFLDLSKMVEILRKAQPEVRFTLEMITRDPLKVPCLTEEYWATFADVPGRDLARTLRTVRGNASKQPLPRISNLSAEEQVEREEQNIKACLAHARDHLGI